MGLTRLRRTPVITAGVIAALLLAGCDSGASDDADDRADEAAAAADTASAADEEDEAEEAADEPLRAGAGTATVLSSVPDLLWKDIQASTDSLIEAPLAQVRVTQVALVTELPEELASDVLPGVSGDGPVLAAEGEQFVVAVITVDDPQWHPRSSTNWPTPTADILLNGATVSGLSFGIEQGSRQQSTVLVSVPEDVSAEDLVVELASDEKYQQLSLIDGTRVSSDVEYIYSRAIEVEVAENSWEGEYRQITGQDDHLRGEVVAGRISPVLPQHGWARPGNVFLSLEIDTRQLPGAANDLTVAYLQLEDGSTMNVENDPSSLLLAFADEAVFQVPADARSITVVVEPSVEPGAGFSEVAFDTVEVELTLSGSPDGTEPDSKDDA